jgi:hypothetical protein
VTIIAKSAEDPSISASTEIRVGRPTSEPYLMRTLHFSISEPAEYGAIRDLIIDIDGNVIAAGPVYANEGDLYQFGLTQSVDSYLDPLWSYLSDSYATGIEALSLAADGRTLFAAGGRGVASEPFEPYPTLLQLDSSGQLQGENTCGNAPIRNVFGSITSVSSGFYLSAFRNTHIYFADLSGQVDCDNTIPVPTDGLGDPIVGKVVGVDGGLLVAITHQANHKCFKGYRNLVRQIDGSGSALWTFDVFSDLDSSQHMTSNTQIILGDTTTSQAIYAGTSISTPQDADCQRENEHDSMRQLVQKLDMQGNLEWARTWDSDRPVSACENYLEDIVPDPHGGVITIGRSNADCGNHMECAIASYTSDGELRWTMRPNVSVDPESTRVLNYCTAGAVSADGEFLYLSGTPLFISKVALPESPEIR